MVVAAVSAPPRFAAQAEPSPAPGRASAQRTSMGVAATCFSRSPRTRSAFEFLEYGYSLGAGGVQAPLASFSPDHTKMVRQRVEELGMYLEVFASLPRVNTEIFERQVKAAKEAGAISMRAACLDGRRYETFSSLDGWKSFVETTRVRIARSLPVLEKHRMPLGIENHKDWTAEELLRLMKDYSSEYLGVCIDTGNNIALLDDPMEVISNLAPFAVSTHFKDMAVEEYADGFLLSEVPLGQGILDLRRIVETVLKARPRTKLTLEMITRDPLKIPCLSEKYWATFPERSGKQLAGALRLVRAHKPRQPLPRVEDLDSAARQRLEEDNVKICLAYARDELGLRPH